MNDVLDYMRELENNISKPERKEKSKFQIGDAVKVNFNNSTYQPGVIVDISDTYIDKKCMRIYSVYTHYTGTRCYLEDKIEAIDGGKQ